METRDDAGVAEARAPGISPARAERSLRGTGVTLAVLAAVGLLASLALTVDRIRLLEDPAYVPSCDLNPVLSCGSVMTSEQASVLGFPNPLLGLIGFSVVITLGVVLAAGARVPAWVLGGLVAGSAAGALFVHWLAFQSLYRIDALCPWCLVVWAVTVPIALWSVLAAARGSRSRLVRTTWEARLLLVALWYLVVLVLILIRFWDYWSTLL
ncbi:vitamin K epoxide reductase family protein [Nocardioides sp. zg-DK7169]|uniref:vitamin K epoxide reductase family protein n=1 Tax=Nocardioides sp. zg-DK7169 TaxID=2736600 RepID=UPI001557DE02|nr:vitamin K epoxide reductase family protein [Nocardioides sp. zg-DK7169]NPC96486.1 vitamin K epoxide reductase family protein [Nocardioides sp. zg-DK7169]